MDKSGFCSYGTTPWFARELNAVILVLMKSLRDILLVNIMTNIAGTPEVLNQY